MNKDDRSTAISYIIFITYMKIYSVELFLFCILALSSAFTKNVFFGNWLNPQANDEFYDMDTAIFSTLAAASFVHMILISTASRSEVVCKLHTVILQYLTCVFWIYLILFCACMERRAFLRVFFHTFAELTCPAASAFMVVFVLLMSGGAGTKMWESALWAHGGLLGVSACAVVMLLQQGSGCIRDTQNLPVRVNFVSAYIVFWIVGIANFVVLILSHFWRWLYAVKLGLDFCLIVGVSLCSMKFFSVSISVGMLLPFMVECVYLQFDPADIYHSSSSRSETPVAEIVDETEQQQQEKKTYESTTAGDDASIIEDRGGSWQHLLFAQQRSGTTRPTTTTTTTMPTSRGERLLSKIVLQGTQTPKTKAY